MRLFVAVEVPAEIREQIGLGVERLRRELPPARWVRSEGIHLTLKFLGECEESLPGALAERARPLLAARGPGGVALAGGGFFPDRRRPRVAWLGGSAPGLEAIAADVDAAATSLGVNPETRPFSLHVTLARLDTAWGEAAAGRFLERVGSWELAPFTAREAVVFRSELRPSGAVHTPVERLVFGEEGP
jgi:RNA 2',3'-cyclic 3'-phosphodiesterase